MILGTGNDLLSTKRLEKTLQRFGRRFIQRCFTPEEQKLAAQREASGLHIARYAKAFAAKEAIAKALGTGFRGGICMNEISVTRSPSGTPLATLHGQALARLQSITPDGYDAHIHLSLSDEKDLVQAIAIIEARGKLE